jgi:hypothetical protein
MIYFDKLNVLLRSPSDPPDVLERFSLLDRRWVPFPTRASDLLEQLQRISEDDAVTFVFDEVAGVDDAQARALVHDPHVHTFDGA